MQTIFAFPGHTPPQEWPTRRRLLAMLMVGMWFLTTGCTGEIRGPGAGTLDDNQAPTLVLEGLELANELASSPVREAPVPFTRLGLIWDAPEGGQIEIMTSPDGLTWSDWQPVRIVHIEAEAEDSYVGQLELSSELPGLYYRLRASGETPTFLVLEFIELPLSDMLEDGDAVEDEAAYATGPTLFFAVGNAQVNPRSAWNARASRCTSNHSPNRITIHHTVTPTNDSLSPEARLRQIQAYHMDVNGWCDIGYHFLVSRDGRIWEGRPAHRLGAHVANNNSNNLGISFMGTHTSTPATNTQISNVGALVRGLANQYGFSINNLKGHRDYNSTDCPGSALYAQLDDIIAAANGGGSGGTVLKGIIYEGNDTSQRIPGATVQLNGGATTTTNSNGYYEFHNVINGTRTITASAPGYQTRSITLSVSGPEVWGSIGLEPIIQTSTVKGIVYKGTDTNQRIVGATVKLGNRTTTTNSNGYYEFTEVPHGTHTVTVSAPGYETRSLTRAVSGDETWMSVGLSPVAPSGTATLQGVIYQGSNTAARVPGAIVQLSSGQSTTADQNGFYIFRNLAPGTYTISAHANGVGSGQTTRTIENGTVTWGSVSLQ